MRYRSVEAAEGVGQLGWYAEVAGGDGDGGYEWYHRAMCPAHVWGGTGRLREAAHSQLLPRSIKLCGTGAGPGRACQPGGRCQGGCVHVASWEAVWLWSRSAVIVGWPWVLRCTAKMGEPEAHTGRGQT